MLVLTLLIAVVAMWGASLCAGLSSFALVAAGCVWAGVGITAWLIMLSPHGWFGQLGHVINTFMEEPEFDPDNPFKDY